jgi:hypothetical protein
MLLNKVIKVQLFPQIKKYEILFQKMLVFVCVFFLVNVALKKLMFQEQSNGELILSSLVVTLVVSLVFYFLNRKKTTSKDN